MNKHDLISRLKDLAIELGRTPFHYEFFKAVPQSRWSVIREFGNYTVMVIAAGLVPGSNGKKKIDNSIFEKDINTQIEGHVSSEKNPLVKVSYVPTAILGDLHNPFVHQKKVAKAVEIIGALKPKRVIQVGDLYDMLSHGKFPRSLNVYTPAEEMNLARKMATRMWEDIRKLVPGVECHQILGNHDIRPMKRVLEQFPEAELFMDFEKWFKFDGVQTYMDLRSELILDGIAYIHGYKTKLGEHMEFMRRPVVCGHSHRAGIIYKNYGDDVYWEMNVGYIGDPESKALSYTPQKYTHWTHAMGVITEHGPQIITL